MPIFEYICKDCRKRFEALLYGSSQPQCPLCKGTNLDQQISTFSVGATRASHSPAANLPCAGGACCMPGGACPNAE